MISIGGGYAHGWGYDSYCLLMNSSGNLATLSEFDQAKGGPSLTVFVILNKTFINHNYADFVGAIADVGM